MVLSSLPQRLFDGIPCCFNNEMVSEDGVILTKSQIEVIDKFLKIRLLRYEQYFTEMTVKKGQSGIRQKLNKSVIFQGLSSLRLVSSMICIKCFI